jgi:hypothetical protein
MAAARRAFADIASARLKSIFGVRLAVFLMIPSPFSRFGKARRDDAHPLAAHGVADHEQMLLDHAQQDETTLAMMLPAVLANHGKHIVECKTSSFEAHAMDG